jgi:hypothetical protein
VKIFYGRVEYGIEDVAPMLAYLRAHPDEVENYQRVTLDNITSLMSWGDYHDAKRLFNTLCAVLAAHRRAAGEDVRE